MLHLNKTLESSVNVEYMYIALIYRFSDEILYFNIYALILVKFVGQFISLYSYI